MLDHCKISNSFNAFRTQASVRANNGKNLGDSLSQYSKHSDDQSNKAMKDGQGK